MGKFELALLLTIFPSLFLFSSKIARFRLKRNNLFQIEIFNANDCLARIETFMLKRENINSFCKQNDTRALQEQEKKKKLHNHISYAVALKKSE